jgi:uncharacterized membrane protein YfcA
MFLLILIFTITCFFSLLTFYSGFGLGTLLTPVMMLFFPFDIAIALTGIVHLFNNLLKFLLVKKHIDWNVFLRFGLPAIVLALIGSSVLLYTSHLPVLKTYQMFGKTFRIEPMKLIIALLLIIFTLMDFIPKLKNFSFDKKYLFLGGALSGFFGGLSGNQGALRTVFLIKSGLSKEAFVATSVAVSTAVDLTRIGVYSQQLISINLHTTIHLFIFALSGALIGTWIGNRLLKKITMNKIQKITTVFLIVIAFLLGIGFL